jgi:sodium transport system permease protein
MREWFMLANVLLVYFKDLKETFRDRRTLIRLMLVSILMLPAMGHLMVTYGRSFRDESRTEPLAFTAVGADHLAELMSAYTPEHGFQEVTLPQGQAIADAVRSGQIQFGLEIPQDAREQLQSGGQVSIRFYYDNASSKQEFVRDRATRPIAQFSERQRDWRLTLLGVTGGPAKESILYPVTYEESRTAGRRQEIGQNYGGLVSYFAFLICFMGCAFTAVDLGAGEKERGTLESLLLAPVPRRDLVLGKYLVVMTMGILYSTLLLFSIVGWLRLESLGSSGVSDEILRLVEPVDLLIVWLMLLPVAAIFAALLLALSIYAKSLREANGLTGLSNIIVVLAVVFATLPGIELVWTWAIVPITSVALAMRELLKGTMNYAMLSVIVGSSTIIAALLLSFCTKWFERESVIFRE